MLPEKGIYFLEVHPTLGLPFFLKKKRPLQPQLPFKNQKNNAHQMKGHQMLCIGQSILLLLAL